jgi:hypothetical protein
MTIRADIIRPTAEVLLFLNVLIRRAFRLTGDIKISQYEYTNA